MMNRKCCIAAMLTSGVLAFTNIGQAQPRLTTPDCKLIYPGANSSEAIRTLASGVQWTEAWEQGAWGRAEDFLGYVFLKSQVYEGKSIAVLVGVASTGLITSVRVKGSENIEEEFLAQFRGKSVRGNFNLVRAPEDLLPVPAGIRLMPDKADLSESITFALREIAQAAGEVIR